MPLAHSNPDRSFSSRLVAWQQRQGRHDLPWQGTRDPYRIWLSEIMLQQTQVATVIPYYRRFLERFPDVAALAAAAPEAVAEAWAGLGYYSRARNLHRCAQKIVADWGGQFPSSPEALASLPGIGRSTAAAVAAFAWGRRAAILDGNVKRVLCRHFGVEGFPGQAAVEKPLWALAESLLPASRMEAYTQGLMDLGATLCTRSRPRCGDCPLAETCVARREGRQADLPTPKPRGPVPERRSTFLLVSDGKGILLQRRPPAGLWGGLLVPPEGDPGPVLAALGLTGAQPVALPEFRHAFTHFRLRATPLLVNVPRPPALVSESGWEWLDLGDAAVAALPAPFKRLFAAPPFGR